MKEVLTLKENVPFTQIANAVLNDPAISWKAKGLFSYIYSKPQSWEFSGHRITDDSTDGRDSTYAGLKELESAGYLLRIRKPDGSIEYEISWKKSVFETPEPDTEIPYEAQEGARYGKSQIRKTRTVSNKEGTSNKEEISASQSSAVLPKADAFFRKKGADDGIAMRLADFVLMCRGSAFRHVRLIGEYADEIKPTFLTRGQWRGFGARNIRAAQRLAPYTDRQIAYAMELVEKDTKDRGGFISKWGLETIEKYLDKS